jgi:hypothetical protein
VSTELFSDHERISSFIEPMEKSKIKTTTKEKKRRILRLYDLSSFIIIFDMKFSSLLFIPLRKRKRNKTSI